MASNSSCGPITRTPAATIPTSNSTTTIPTSKSTTTSAVTATTAASPARPTPTVQQVQPLPQPRVPQFPQHNQQQRQPPYQRPTNQAAFTAQTPIHITTHLRPQSAKASEPVLYPLASSGRGLLPTPRGIRPQLSNQTVSVANSGGYPPAQRSILAAHPSPSPPPPPHLHARLFAPSDSPKPPHTTHMIRASYMHPSHGHLPAATAATAAVRGITANSLPQAKAASFPCSAPGKNGHKDSTDKCTNEMFATVRGRKVRISEGTSIYALCRSWLRDGYPEETQPQYGDVIKSLPKPSTMPLPESSSPKRKESDDETEAEEEDEKSVESLSAKELLQRHIKRAKRVRSRLREERLQRIARYKSRLALLLPQLPEQCGNETSAGTDSHPHQ